MALADSATQLGCGRDVDQVWDRLDRAPDAHELTCPYCQAARADLQGLARATRQLRGDDETDPDLQLSPLVLDRILAVARSEVRRGRRLPLDQPDADGITPSTISEQAVNAVVRRVGDRTAHLQVRRCTITVDDAGPTRVPGSAPTAEVRPPGPSAVSVSLRVSVAHDVAIPEASNQLRDDVIAAVAQEVGMLVTSVGISVEDVHDV